MKKLLFFILFPLSLNAVSIQNWQTDQVNRSIIKQLIQEIPTNSSLPNQVGEIGQQALKLGFDPTIYQSDHPRFFDAIPIWEGKNQEATTLFVYIWPAGGHHSDIHSHPIPCSWTVLKGKMQQEEYLPKEGMHAKKKSQQTYLPGEGAVDSREELFLHRMLCPPRGAPCCYTLHAYGASSAREVEEIFWRSASKHTYFPESSD